MIHCVRGSRAAALAALLVVITAYGAAGEGQTRNAIFNGDLVEGVTGFAVLGPGYKAVTLSADKSQHAQTLVTELIVSSPQMERTFTLYSTYLLRVRPEGEYQMKLQMAGVGQFAFGAFEYDAAGAHIGNNYSDRTALTPEFQQFTFTYKPSKNATGIRPAIVFFEPTDGSKLDLRARLRSFELPVAAEEFGEMCRSWPDYARNDAFAAYAGFSAAELKELQALETAEPVLPPYQPLTMKAGDCTLTTSRVHLGRTVWPQRLAVLGQEILARPLELTVRYGDGKRPVPQGAATVRAAGHRADLSQQFRAGGRTVTVSLALHHDALLVYTLDFSAAPGASLAEASLAIPFTHQVARSISYDRPVAPDAPAAEGWVFGYGPIPRPGERVETRATIGSAVMGEAVANDWQPAVPGPDGLIWEWQRGFLPMAWVGDEARGLSLMSLSAQGYRADPGDATVRLTRDAKAVTLTYRFITRPVRLDKARRLQFALQIMPPKPVRDNWLATRCNPVFPGYATVVDEALPLLEERLKPGGQPTAPGAVRSYLTAYDVIREGAAPRPWQATEYRPYRDMGFLWYTLWAQGARPTGQGVGGCSTPLVGSSERLTRIVKISDMIGHLPLPYLAATHIAAEDPAGYYYVERQDEWTLKPRVPRPAYLRPTCPNSLFSAYLARGVGRLIDEYGIAGIYFDNCAPYLCQNTKHGCGYVDDDGVLRPTLPLLGFRRLFRMVRAEFVKRGKEPLILTHAGMYPAAISFTDVELQGEGTYGSDHTQMFTLGEWRTRWLGPGQFGVQLTYLPAFGYGLGPNVDRVREEMIGTPRLLAMALLHGTQVWNQYLNSPLLYQVWTVLDELDEPDVVFTPYWQWPAVNGPLNAQGVYATAYAGQERILLVLSNLSAEAQQVTVPLAAIRTRTGAVTQVADHMHGLPVDLEGGMLRCTVEGKNFRLLSFTP
jgi:hypothetical protein